MGLACPSVRLSLCPFSSALFHHFDDEAATQCFRLFLSHTRTIACCTFNFFASISFFLHCPFISSVVFLGFCSVWAPNSRLKSVEKPGWCGCVLGQAGIVGVPVFSSKGQTTGLGLSRGGGWPHIMFVCFAGTMVVVKLDGPALLCKTDEVGELCLSSNFTGTGYWGLPGMSNTSFKVQQLVQFRSVQYDTFCLPTSNSVVHCLKKGPRHYRL